MCSLSFNIFLPIFFFARSVSCLQAQSASIQFFFSYCKRVGNCMDSRCARPESYPTVNCFVCSFFRHVSRRSEEGVSHGETDRHFSFFFPRSFFSLARLLKSDVSWHVTCHDCRPLRIKQIFCKSEHRTWVHLVLFTRWEFFVFAGRSFFEAYFVRVAFFELALREICCKCQNVKLFSFRFFLRSDIGLNCWLACGVFFFVFVLWADGVAISHCWEWWTILLKCRLNAKCRLDESFVWSSQ